jgi:hypothetical protein
MGDCPDFAMRGRRGRRGSEARRQDRVRCWSWSKRALTAISHGYDTTQKERHGTLHIEHAISDLNTSLGAFRKFAEAREKAGVRTVRIYQPVDDDRYIVVDLDFDTVEGARTVQEVSRDQRVVLARGVAGPFW